MPPPSETGKWEACSQHVRSFVHPSDCYQTILTPIGKSGPRDKDMKRSTLGVRRSKNKVTQGWIH